MTMLLLGLVVVALSLWVASGMTIVSVAQRRNPDASCSLALAAAAGPLTGVVGGRRR